MSEHDRAKPAAGDWDYFWRARGKAVIQEQIGVHDPAPAVFWRQFFGRALAGRGRARLIDIACGAGPVTIAAIEVAPSVGVELDAHCVDFSAAAVTELRSRYAQVEGVACDARSIPYPDRSFDLVVSQFGIEYGGDAAFAEAARLVAAGGVLAAIVHLAGSALHRECADNLSVVTAVNRSRLVPLARAAFAAGFDQIAGNASIETFREHNERLAPAIEVAKKILREKGPRAVGGLLQTLYRDMGHMYRRMRNYAPGDVFAWLDLMERELVSYEGRMASMTACALDEAAIARVAQSLTAVGLVVDAPQTLSLQSSGEAAGWILSARRERS